MTIINENPKNFLGVIGVRKAHELGISSQTPFKNGETLESFMHSLFAPERSAQSMSEDLQKALDEAPATQTKEDYSAKDIQEFLIPLAINAALYKGIIDPCAVFQYDMGHGEGVRQEPLMHVGRISGDVEFIGKLEEISVDCQGAHENVEL